MQCRSVKTLPSLYAGPIASARHRDARSATQRRQRDIGHPNALGNFRDRSFPNEIVQVLPPEVMALAWRRLRRYRWSLGSLYLEQFLPIYDH
jgi:hypothetical protein